MKFRRLCSRHSSSHKIISQRGTAANFADMPDEDRLDRPSPAPWRCFDLGRAVARVLVASPWRVALVASSSWSHAFLTPKHQLLYPDINANRSLYDKLRTGDYQVWRATPLAAIEASGQHEMLHWMCLAGAMSELDRQANTARFVETYTFNSNKCFAAFSG